MTALDAKSVSDVWETWPGNDTTINLAIIIIIYEQILEVKRYGMCSCVIVIIIIFYFSPPLDKKEYLHEKQYDTSGGGGGGGFWATDAYTEKKWLLVKELIQIAVNKRSEQYLHKHNFGICI